LSGVPAESFKESVQRAKGGGKKVCKITPVTESITTIQQFTESEEGIVRERLFHSQMKERTARAEGSHHPETNRGVIISIKATSAMFRDWALEKSHVSMPWKGEQIRPKQVRKKKNKGAPSNRRKTIHFVHQSSLKKEGGKRISTPKTSAGTLRCY